MTYTTLFDLLDDTFGTFNRPFKEIEKYKLYKKDNGYYLFVANAIGIDNDNIEVSLEQPETGIRVYPRLVIKGKKKNPINEYEYEVNYSANLLIKEPIESINYDLSDGVLNVILKTKEPDASQKLTASRVDLSKFEW